MMKTCFIIGMAVFLHIPLSTAQEPATPQELMDQIGAVFSEKDDNGQSLTDEACRLRVQPLEKKLAACGSAAVSLIQDRIAKESNHRTRSALVYSLGMIPGEAVDRILLRFFCFEPGLGSSAGSQLIWRAEHNGPFSFPVPSDQIERLATVVRSGYIHEVQEAIRILGMCAKNDTSQLSQTIVDRYIKEVNNPPSPGAQPKGGPGSYVSPRAVQLSIFLRAFSYVPDMVLPGLRLAYAAAKQAKEEELTKCLAMAMGVCGDVSVEDYLKGVVLNDPDRYMRWVAIFPYERSGYKSTIPVLRQLLDDPTETEYGDSPIKNFIAGAAHESLARINKRMDTLSESPFNPADLVVGPVPEKK